MKSIIFGLAMLLLVPFSIAKDLSPFIIGTYSSPPYQYIKDDTIIGDSVYTVQCIFYKLQKDPVFDIYPLKRALHELKTNTINGVFPVHTPNTVKHNHSAPISIEKWYWLTNFIPNHDTIFDKEIRIGAVNGSPAYFWLLQNNISIDSLVTTKEQLVKMFKAGRLDAIIIDDNENNRGITFHNNVKSQGPYWSFIKFEPHHFIFSEHSLTTYPHLLTKFNENIASCKPISLKTSKHEKYLLIEYLKVYKEELLNFLQSHQYFSQFKKVFTNTSNQEIDAQWQAEIINAKGPLHDFTINSKLGSFTTKLQKQSNGGISEIIIMDAGGYAVALSQATTNFYQGDEEKFLKAFPLGGNTVFVSDIIYDDSTRKYQSQVSFTIINNSKPIGVVTFGVDIEKILLNEKYSPSTLLKGNTTQQTKE